jgi:hypothetical protein
LYSRWLGFGAYQWRAEDYISFVCKFLLGMGLGFELPVVILTMVKIGVVGYKTLAKIRPYMIVINLILGAVLTTPEVITQITMFIPLQCLYELSVWVAWYWEQPDRSKARRRLVQVLVVALLVVVFLVLLRSISYGSCVWWFAHISFAGRFKTRFTTSRFAVSSKQSKQNYAKKVFPPCCRCADSGAGFRMLQHGTKVRPWNGQHL